MVDLPKRKVGIIACSGEELAQGTVTRLAALKVLEQLRPQDTVTICLPLFLAGGEGDRAFARFYPTIAIDGCDKRCAAQATEKYSGKPAASFVIDELAIQHKIGEIDGQRRLNQAGMEMVEIAAEAISQKVDTLLEKSWSRSMIEKPPSDPDLPVIALPEVNEETQATCACGSGIPIQKVVIGGEQVTLIALPLLFSQFRQDGRVPDERTRQDLTDSVKIYNPLPADDRAYANAILEAYADYLKKESQQ